APPSTRGAAGAAPRAPVAARSRVAGEGGGDEVQAPVVEDRPAQTRPTAPTAAGATIRAAGPALGLAAGQRHVLDGQAGPGKDAEDALRVAAADGDAVDHRRAPLDGELVAGLDDQGGRPEGERVVGVVARQRDGLAGDARSEDDGVGAAVGISSID